MDAMRCVKCGRTLHAFSHHLAWRWPREPGELYCSDDNLPCLDVDGEPDRHLAPAKPTEGP